MSFTINKNYTIVQEENRLVINESGGSAPNVKSINRAIQTLVASQNQLDRNDFSAKDIKTLNNFTKYIEKSIKIITEKEHPWIAPLLILFKRLFGNLKVLSSFHHKLQIAVRHTSSSVSKVAIQPLARKEASDSSSSPVTAQSKEVSGSSSSSAAIHSTDSTTKSDDATDLEFYKNLSFATSKEAQQALSYYEKKHVLPITLDEVLLP